MLRLQLRRGMTCRVCPTAPRNFVRYRQQRTLRRRATSVVSADIRVFFRVQHHVKYGERVGILGGHPTLGNWKKDKVLRLKWNDGDVWTIDCVLDTTDDVEYKYVRLDGEGEVQEWCPGDNLIVDLSPHCTDKTMTLNEIWGKKGMQRETSEAKTERSPPPPPCEEPLPPKEPSPPTMTVHERGGRRPVPSLVDENRAVSHKEIDIGCPFDAPVTIYIVEQNPILSSIVGVNIKLPAFPVVPW